MTIAILNILIGVAMVLGGVSGRFTLLGTNSGTLLMAVGGVIIVIGIYQLAKNIKPRDE